MTKSYELMYSGSNRLNVVEEKEEAIREAIQQTRRVTFWNFKTKEEVESFIRLFPKYIKLYSFECLMYNKEVNGEIQHKKVPCCEFEVSKVTGVTGDVNETGLKRINGLVRSLKRHGYIA